MAKSTPYPTTADVQATLHPEREVGARLREARPPLSTAAAAKAAAGAAPANRPRAHAANQPGAKASTDLLADLADARRAERVAASFLREAREQLAATVARGREEGIRYDRLAQHSLRAIHGQTVTLAERAREAVRLRKLAHRHRVSVTGGHGSRLPAPGMSPESRPPSIAQGEQTMAPRLISRKITEERFVGVDEDEHIDEADDTDDDDGEKDTGATETPRATRPRR